MSETENLETTTDTTDSWKAMDPRSIADACHQIDEVLDELGRLAASEATAEQFHAQLAAQAVRESGALACGVWLHDTCAFETIAPRDGAPPNGACFANRRQLVGSVIATGKAIIQPIAADRPGANPLWLAVAVPILLESQATGAVELLFSSDASKSTQARALEIAEALAEIGGDYYRHRQISNYHKRELHWTSFAQFVKRIDRTTLQQTAVAVANEGRWFVGCDRLSVVESGLATAKVLSVSGVDRLEPRSSLVTGMRQLAAAVLTAREPIWQIDEPITRAPQLDEPLQAFLEQSHARAVVVLPLDCHSPPASGEQNSRRDGADSEIGALLIEWFTTPQLAAEERERIELLREYGGMALSRAAATDRLPFIRVSRALDKIAWLTRARSMRTTRWAIAAAAVILMALMLLPADFQITVDGELLPAERREVFAPADGIVDSLFVEHGDEAAAGQPLLHMRSSALEYEIARVQGELQTAEKRLAAIRTARYDRTADARGSADRYLQLTSEEEELGETCKSLRQQELLLARQRSELDVQSPIAGRVLTWDVGRSLAARPVERGQSLLSIGNVTGPWSLELRVPDDQIGYVLNAAELARRQDHPLNVSFLLIAEPGRTYDGTVERIGLRSTVSDHGTEPVVLVTVRVTEPINSPRPGAGVVGKFHCGTRSLGFVWLHNAWNSIRRRLLF